MIKKTKGTIASGNPYTAEAAAIMLREGGNAFDAAVAALFAATVCEPAAVSIGGGAFMTATTADKQDFVLDFFCQTPGKKIPFKDLEDLLFEVDFGPAQESYRYGKASIAVPGVLAGAFEMIERWGSLPMDLIVAPAVSYAREGYPVGKFMANYLRFLDPILSKQQSGRDIYRQKDQSLPEGATLRNGALADFIQFLGKDGCDEFYRGEIASKIAEDFMDGSGFLTRRDFEKYEPILQKGSSIYYQQHEVITPTIPSFGGMLLGKELEASLEAPMYRMRKKEELHKIAHRYHDLLEEREQALAKWHAAKWSGTTHFSVMDEHGNAVAITGSNGEGSGYMIPGTGVMLNNMLGEPSLLPAGDHSWKENIRLASMMAPTIVKDDRNEVRFVLGSGGASRIPFILAQVLHHLIDDKRSLEEAIMAPRMHLEHDTIHIELGLEADKEGAYWEKMAFFEEPSFFFGGVHAIEQRKGRLIGFADPRRDGVVVEV